MSTLFVNNLNTASGSTITIPTGKQVIVTDEGGLRVPGSVIQVVNAEKLDTAATNSAMPSWIDTGLSCTITPKASNSKILVHADYAGGVTTAAFNYFRVVRNVGGGSYSMISEGATPGSRNAIHGMVYDSDNQGQVCLQTFNHLDSPATTSAVNYKLQFATGGGGSYVYIGQSNRDTDGAAADPRAASRIVLQEIAQ
tara:strand:+ start:195 stop:785 length:591 start_codon:yes stop_codon:yes gene_type:complete